MQEPTLMAGGTKDTVSAHSFDSDSDIEMQELCNKKDDEIRALKEELENQRRRVAELEASGSREEHADWLAHAGEQGLSARELQRFVEQDLHTARTQDTMGEYLRYVALPDVSPYSGKEKEYSFENFVEAFELKYPGQYWMIKNALLGYWDESCHTQEAQEGPGSDMYERLKDAAMRVERRHLALENRARTKPSSSPWTQKKGKSFQMRHPKEVHVEQKLESSKADLEKKTERPKKHRRHSGRHTVQSRQVDVCEEKVGYFVRVVNQKQEWKSAKMQEIVQNNNDVFAVEDSELTQTSLVTHDVDTGNT
ncbi:unnamed protein product [Haemonchus placei]|uniref:Uncharacterized protein n=1 Tax=Haemonchus placei TaxID=6290 RepID=A0A3P7Z0J6_HAEPC|nr:unnamed protein product [Haemonchus placei]